MTNLKVNQNNMANIKIWGLVWHHVNLWPTIVFEKKTGDFNASMFFSKVLQSILGKSTMVNEYLTQQVKTTTHKRVK
jgi:hypothetical protein